MDYFFDEGRPDVVAAAAVVIVRVVVFVFDDMMIMLTIKWSTLCEDITSKPQVYPTFYTNKLIKQLRRRVIFTLIIALQFDAIVKPDAVVLVHFTQRALLLWLEDLVPVIV